MELNPDENNNNTYGFAGPVEAEKLQWTLEDKHSIETVWIRVSNQGTVVLRLKKDADAERAQKCARDHKFVLYEGALDGHIVILPETAGSYTASSIRGFPSLKDAANAVAELRKGNLPHALTVVYLKDIGGFALRTDPDDRCNLDHIEQAGMANTWFNGRRYIVPCTTPRAASLHDLVRQQSQDNRSLRTAKKALELECRYLSDERKHIDAINSSLHSQIKTLHSQIKTLQDENTTLQDENTTLKKEGPASKRQKTAAAAAQAEPGNKKHPMEENVYNDPRLSRFCLWNYKS